MKLIVRTIALVLLISSVAIAQPTTQPMNTASADRAQLNLLEHTVNRQQQEIVDLKSQVTMLSKQVEGLGFVPATQASTTQPAETRQVRRILFIRTTGGASDLEIVRAVDDLEPTQFFNVATKGSGKIEVFEPQFAPANERNKQKLKAALKGNSYLAGDFIDAFEVVAKWRPDLVVLVGTPPIRDEEADIKQIKKYLRGIPVRVNTSLVGIYSGTEITHYLWRVAHETGGVCVDSQGQEISEPALPIKSTPPPAPPEPKTRLRTK